MSDTQKLEEFVRKVKEVETALAAERHKSEELSQKLKTLEPDNEENAVALLTEIANNPDGLTLDQIAAATKLHRERVRLVLQTSQKVGHTQAHGGGDDPLRYKLADGGRVFLMSKGVI